MYSYFGIYNDNRLQVFQILLEYVQARNGCNWNIKLNPSTRSFQNGYIKASVDFFNLAWTFSNEIQLGDQKISLLWNIILTEYVHISREYLSVLEWVNIWYQSNWSNVLSNVRSISTYAALLINEINHVKRYINVSITPWFFLFSFNFIHLRRIRDFKVN